METNPDHTKENLSSKDFAYNTLVATPDGEKIIQYLNKGDEVLAFSAKQESGKLKLESFTAKINFSSGTGDYGHQPAMAYLSIGEPYLQKNIICTTDQVYLLSNGKYTTAGKLRPGLQLVEKDGNPIDITMVSIGNYRGGVHNIATDAPINNNPDGHLIVSNGVIAGDYVLQIHFRNMPDSIKYDNE
ncbi:hypothetical protein [Flavobacterium defluvii]|uniref:Uncharacterized protein n=1 Tax=Flavobacterium defluvii TaxID=370979 RepID=A0A1M5IPB9_9FLAO|nr:hypothetical protein [Flavobacterium defluvii]SHG30194.1 hypothetical protein SAMN05443663_102470 [Flavobacterium defluvii]